MNKSAQILQLSVARAWTRGTTGGTKQNFYLLDEKKKERKTKEKRTTKLWFKIIFWFPFFSCLRNAMAGSQNVGVWVGVVANC